MMINQVTPAIETVELFAPNTGNRQVIINGALCYEWEFQGILYYPTVEFVPYEENPCQDPMKEVYRLNGSRVGTLQWFGLNLNVDEYELYHDDDDEDEEDDEVVAIQAAAKLLTQVHLQLEQRQIGPVSIQPQPLQRTFSLRTIPLVTRIWRRG